MFSSPDLPTLRLCSFLASAAYGALFLILWTRRRRETYLLHWSLSSAFYALALVVFEFGTHLPPGFGSGLGFGLIAGSDLLILSGMRRFDGERPFASWMAAPLTATIVGSMLPLMIGLPPTEASALSRSLGSATLAVCAFVCALAIWMDGRRDGALPRRIVAGALLAYLPGYALSIDLQLSAPLRPDVASIAPLLLRQLLLGILNLGLLATPWERALRQLKESVLRDALTGAWNRTALKQHEGALVLPEMSLFLIDVDHFKSINDTYGHAAGDAVLVAFSGRIQALAAERGGMFVRLGGDEFVMLAPTADDRDAAILAEQIRAMPDPAITGLPPFSISIGVSRVHLGETVLSQALARADASLYRAKASGRNQVAA
jgi:diguanylate cyclase (GGDEF)-like protein